MMPIQASSENAKSKYYNIFYLKKAKPSDLLADTMHGQQKLITANKK